MRASAPQVFSLYIRRNELTFLQCWQQILKSHNVATNCLQLYCQHHALPIISNDIYSYNSTNVHLHSVGIIWITCLMHEIWIIFRSYNLFLVSVCDREASRKKLPIDPLGGYHYEFHLLSKLQITIVRTTDVWTPVLAPVSIADYFDVHIYLWNVWHVCCVAVYQTISRISLFFMISNLIILKTECRWISVIITCPY
jgi:hypothetical protein